MKEVETSKIQINVCKDISKLKHKNIVNKLLKKYNDICTAMNKVQDIVEKLQEDDPKGVNKFFNKINKEMKKTEGQDCLLVNGVLFDWKQFNRPEMLGELTDLALNCMSNENSKNKLENMLLK